MNNKIRVVVIDDNPLFREGVGFILGSQRDMTVAGRGVTVAEAICMADKLKPEVLVLDITMAGGSLAAIAAIAAAHPAVNVLVLTAADSTEAVTAAMRAGARGYLLKDASVPQLVATVRTVSRGEAYVAPALAARLLRAPLEVVRENLALSTLSSREQEITTLLSKGLSNKEIGLKLTLSEKTVKHYLTNVLKKLNVRNRVEAALLYSGRKESPTPHLAAK